MIRAATIRRRDHAATTFRFLIETTPEIDRASLVRAKPRWFRRFTIEPAMDLVHRHNLGERNLTIRERGLPSPDCLPPSRAASPRLLGSYISSSFTRISPLVVPAELLVRDEHAF
jgi:hypothetical protein